MTAITSLTKSITKRRDFVRLLWSGTILLNLFVIGMVAWVIKNNHERETVQASTLTENYSRILEENLVGFISKIDITLLTVREEVSRQKARGGIDDKAINAFIAQQDTHIPEALGLRVVDAQGIIRHAVNDVKVRNVSIADRPQFIRLRDDPDAGLVFSKPVMGRAAQKWLITLGRRLDNPDGSFAGDVHVAVAVDQFIEMFSKIDLGPNGNIGLWDKTNLIARYARDDSHGSSVGSNTPSAQLHGLLNSDRKAGPYHARSGVDGISRSYYFRQVNNYPLYLVVGIADQDYLAQWRSDSLGIVGLACLFVIATLSSSALIYRGWKRRETDQEILLRQEEEYTAKLEKSNHEAEAAWQRSDLILTSAGEGICGVDLEGKVLFVNPAARKMFGWGEEEGPGLELHNLTHHHQANGNPFPRTDCAVYKTLCDGKKRQVKDELFWRKDGTSFPVEYTVAAMEQDGKISGAVNIFRDITERKNFEERIIHMALFDALTGLHNRSYLSDSLQRIAALATRRREAVGILYLDLDGFKDINDTMGHAVGDAVLCEVASRLSACVRAEDLVIRLGGDEFLVIAMAGKENARDYCIALARRIIETTCQTIVLSEGLVRVSVSIGIAVFPDCHGSIEHCIQKADAAMYQAKKAGKGCFAMSSDGESPASDSAA